MKKRKKILERKKITHKTQFCILELIKINLIKITNFCNKMNWEIERLVTAFECHTPNSIFPNKQKTTKTNCMNNNEIGFRNDKKKWVNLLLRYDVIDWVSVRLFKKVLLMSGLMLYMRSGSDNWVITRIHNQLMLCILHTKFISNVHNNFIPPKFKTKTNNPNSSNSNAKQLIKTPTNYKPKKKNTNQPNNRWPTEVERCIVRCEHQTWTSWRAQRTSFAIVNGFLFVWCVGLPCVRSNCRYS